MIYNKNIEEIRKDWASINETIKKYKEYINKYFVHKNDLKPTNALLATRLQHIVNYADKTLNAVNNNPNLGVEMYKELCKDLRELQLLLRDRMLKEKKAGTNEVKFI